MNYDNYRKKYDNMKKITKISDAQEYLQMNGFFTGKPRGETILYWCVISMFRYDDQYVLQKLYDSFYVPIIEEYNKEYPNNCRENCVNQKYIKKFANIVKKFSEKPELITLI